MNPISTRLLSQQLISPQSNSPHDVVAHMGAMQAQDYKGMRWAVSMRTRHPSQKAFEKDYDDGKIVRTHLFRSTWHLVAAEDYRWMIDLCREKACTGTVHLLPAYDEYLIGYKSRYISLHPDHRHRAHDQKGIFWPVVLMDGEVVGNWSVEKDGVVTDIFHESAILDEDSLKSESARYLKFLNR